MLGYKFLKPTADPAVFQSPYKPTDWRVDQLPPAVGYLEVNFSGYHFQPSIPELINAPHYNGAGAVLKDYCDNRLVIGEFDVVGKHASTGNNNCATQLKLLRICNRLGAGKKAALTALLFDKLSVGCAHKLPEIQKILATRTRCPFRPGDRVCFKCRPAHTGTVMHTFASANPVTGREFLVVVNFQKRIDFVLDKEYIGYSQDGYMLFSDKKLVKSKVKE